MGMGLLLLSIGLAKHTSFGHTLKRFQGVSGCSSEHYFIESFLELVSVSL